MFNNNNDGSLKEARWEFRSQPFDFLLRRVWIEFASGIQCFSQKNSKNLTYKPKCSFSEKSTVLYNCSDATGAKNNGTPFFCKAYFRNNRKKLSIMLIFPRDSREHFNARNIETTSKRVSLKVVPLPIHSRCQTLQYFPAILPTKFRKHTVGSLFNPIFLDIASPAFNYGHKFCRTIQQKIGTAKAKYFTLL